MRIVLNGREHETPDGGTILALLEMNGLAPGQVAVELNGRVVSRADFSCIMIKEDDRVEIVRFVGGG